MPDSRPKNVPSLLSFVRDDTLRRELDALDAACNHNGINHPGGAFMAVVL